MLATTRSDAITSNIINRAPRVALLFARFAQKPQIKSYFFHVVVVVVIVFVSEVARRRRRRFIFIHSPARSLMNCAGGERIFKYLFENIKKKTKLVSLLLLLLNCTSILLYRPERIEPTSERASK